MESRRGAGGRAARSNQCRPLCRLAFEGLVIADRRLLYLNVSPRCQALLIGMGRAMAPGDTAGSQGGPCCHSPGGNRRVLCPAGLRTNHTEKPTPAKPASHF